MIASNAKSDLTIKNINESILTNVDKLSCADIQNAQRVLSRTLHRIERVATWQTDVAKLVKSFKSSNARSQAQQLIIELDMVLTDSGHRDLLFKEGIVERYKNLVSDICKDGDAGFSKEAVQTALDEVGLLLKVELPPEPNAWQITKAWFSNLWANAAATGGTDGLTSK
jgi:hypothetical protein